MKEIGGYLGIDANGGQELYEDLIHINLARNAISYLNRICDIKKIYLPFYLCDCVADTCTKEEIDIEFYHIDSNFMPIFEKQVKSDEYLYIVNYFGLLSDDFIENLHHKYNNLILDNAQSFFCKPLKGVFTVYTCRKFFGVPDGAYVSSHLDKRIELKKDTSYNRMLCVLGRTDCSATQFFGTYQKQEEEFYCEDLKEMSNVTVSLMKTIDYQGVADKRCENFNVLNNYLSATNRLKFEKFTNVPYCYPLLTEKAVAIKKVLLENKIYVPTLWPNVLNMPNNTVEHMFSSQILPIPCDQRYNKADMMRIIDLILN